MLTRCGVETALCPDIPALVAPLRCRCETRTGNKRRGNQKRLIDSKVVKKPFILQEVEG